MLAIYVRVSSSQQLKEGESIDVQKKLGIDFAERQKKEYKIYEDGGKSGGSIKSRIGYNQLLRDIELKLIDSVWMRDLSRLNRDLLNSIEFRICIEKNKINLYEDGRLFDFSKGEEILTWNILNSVAEYQRKVAGFLSSKSKHKLLADGKYILGSVPFGYKREDGGLIVDRDDLEVLNIIWNGIEEGKTLITIQKELFLKYGKNYIRNGKILTFHVVWILRIIRNELYYRGIVETKFDEIIYEFQVEKLIEKNRWERIYNEHTKKIKLRRLNRVSVFEGKVRCSVCFNKMYFLKQKGWNVKKPNKERLEYVYIGCGNERCKMYRKNMIELRTLGKDFIVFLNKIKNENPVIIDEFKDTINKMYKEYEKNMIGYNREEIIEKIENLDEQLERNRTLYISKDMSFTEYEYRKNEIVLMKEEWENKLMLDGKIYDDKILLDYMDYIKKLSGEGKDDNFIIDKLINKIFVRKVKRDWFEGGFRIFYKIEWNFIGELNNKMKVVLFILLSNTINYNNLYNKIDLMTSTFSSNGNDSVTDGNPMQ